MSFDPRQYGADCARCALRDHTPVKPELRRGARAVLVGEAPGDAEEREGRPFVGPSGLELQRGIASVGLRRAHFSITNALLCRPPDNNLAKVLHDVQRANKARKSEGLAPLPSPIECCRPRLLTELKAHGSTVNVVTLGGTALWAVSGGRSSILEVRGGPREVIDGDTTLRILPTLHPAFVMHARRWTRAFVGDLGRAVRWFTTGLKWRDPQVIYRPSPAQLRAFFARRTPFFSYDVETAPGFPEWGIYDPCFDRLRCIGFATADGAYAAVVPFMSVTDPLAEFYSGAERVEIVRAIVEFLTNPRILKVTWNGGYYDRMVVEQPAHFGVTPTPHVDGIGLHKFVEPELPHRLGYAGSVYTDAPSWKEDHTAKEATSDADLWLYNARDCGITSLTIPTMKKAVIARDQVRAAKFWPKVQDWCVGMHKAGLHVDQEKRREWDKRLLSEAYGHLKRIRELVERPQFNPNSTAQIADLLFDRWELIPHEYTDLGDPSTGDDSLRAFLATYPLTEVQRETIKAIRFYRRRTKERGTYVAKLRPMAEPLVAADLAFDEEETPDDRAKRLKKLQTKPGIVLADGRFHPDYNGHGTKGWRLSSSNPNAQNFPDRLRNMVIPAPGRLFVGCDQAQLELRMVAGLAGCAMYLAAINAGRDPHHEVCLAFFGDAYVNAPKSHKKALRRFVKEFTYASFYWAGPETIHSVLTASEDEHEKLLYADMSVRETTAFYEKWLGVNPEIPVWWEATVAEWKRQGYLAEPVLGFKCDFLDGEQPNELVNLKPQSGGSAIVHLATERFVDEVPFNKWGPGTGLVSQTHDSLTVEVPREHDRYKPGVKDEDAPEREFGYCPPDCGCIANRTARLLQECMTIDGRPFGLPVTFTGEAKIGTNWKEV